MFDTPSLDLWKMIKKLQPVPYLVGVHEVIIGWDLIGLSDCHQITNDD
jgi:hypothetical protein